MDQRIRRFDRCQLSMTRICTPQTVPPNRLGRVLKTSLLKSGTSNYFKCSDVRTYEPGRLYVRRWNERVRAKRCEVVERGVLRWAVSTFRFLKTIDETGHSMWLSSFLVHFCSEAIGKGEFSGLKTGLQISRLWVTQKQCLTRTRFCTDSFLLFLPVWRVCRSFYFERKIWRYK